MSSKSTLFSSEAYSAAMTSPSELASELLDLLGAISDARGAPPSPLPRYAIQGVPHGVSRMRNGKHAAAA